MTPARRPPSGRGKGGRPDPRAPKSGAPKPRPPKSHGADDRRRGLTGRPPRPPVGTRPGGSGPAARARPRQERGLGGEQVEGRQAVRELLLAGRRRVRDVWLAEDVDDAPVLADILELASELRVTVRRATRRALDEESFTEAPQGVLAHAEPVPEIDLDRLCRSVDGVPPFLVFLDGITDPQNLGALLRSAACTGVTGVVLPRHRSAHITPTVAKAATGAIEHLPMAVVSGLPAALARAKDLGVWVVGLTTEGDHSLFDLTLADEPVSLVLGAEGRGLGRLVRDRCDVLAAIPLRGPLGSLNVAVAGALACFEVARRRGL